MSPFEAQSIEVARNALTVSIVADVIAGIALVAVIFGGIVAYRTLQTILAQLTAGQWSTLLSLEQDMDNRGKVFHDLADQLHASATPLSQEKVDAAKQSYFNAIDRFASLVLNGQFSQRELKQDYHEFITGIIRAFPSDFAPGTHYRKVVKLHEKWEDAI